jgi:fumarate reductase flavoprotein subunit
MKMRTSILISVVLTVLFAAASAGCASTGGGGAAGAAAPIGNASGSAEATAPGFGGDVTVAITMADGYITDVKVTGDMETPTVGGIALTRAPGIIKKQNTAAIDAISGATVTTRAISTAAQAAIDKIVAGN